MSAIHAVLAAMAASSSGPPAFGRALGSNGLFTATSTQPMTVTNNASVGERVAVTIAVGGGLTVSSVTDSKGNSYSQDASAGPISNRRTYVYSCVVATSQNLVATTDTITVTYSSATATDHVVTAVALTNATSLDVAGAATGTGSTETATATTTAATVAVGSHYQLRSGGAPTYTPGSGWTAIDGVVYEYAASYQVFSTAGSKSTGGSWTTSFDWASCFAAYK